MAKKDLIAKGLSLVTALESDPQSLEFRKPVDFTTLGLLDYPAIVKKPMDLSTIKVRPFLPSQKKLKSGKYETIEEVLADVQLIWDNCKAYNLPKSVTFPELKPAGNIRDG